MSTPAGSQSLYEAGREHDACGIGAAVDITGRCSHRIIEYGRQILLNLHHRGAAGADETTGDAERGASLVVRAIASGRKAAEGIHRWLRDNPD